MDKETRDVIKPLIECLASLTEKQALIFELLSLNFSGPEQAKILASAEESHKRAVVLRQSALID